MKVVDELPGLFWVRQLNEPQDNPSPFGPAEIFLASRSAEPSEVVVRLHPAASARHQTRFGDEVASLGVLTGDPHVIRLYDAGVTVTGRPYLVMQHCPDGSLADHLGTVGRLTAREARAIGLKLAGALSRVHSHGLVHGNVKPANVLIDGHGEPLLTDFGLPSLAGTGGGFLTGGAEVEVQPYAAPEAFLPELLEPAADIYSLGALLFCLLAGIPPTGPGRHGVLAGEELPDIYRVPWPFMAVLRQAMALDPRHRFASAAQMHQVLAEAPL